MNKILITGGTGYVGHRVANLLNSQGIDVDVLDQATPQERGVDLVPNIRFHHLKIHPQNQEKLIEILSGYTTVLHLAADIGPIAYMEERQASILLHNALTDAALYPAMVEAGVQSVVYGSSSMVFQGSDKYPYVENDLFSKVRLPKNVYGFSKLSGEYFCTSFRREFGLNYTILRYHNIYGPGEDSKGSTMGDIHVIPALLEKIDSGQYPIQLIGNKDATRPFMYVDDAVKVTAAIVIRANKKDKKVLNNDFNIAAPEVVTIEHLAQRMWSLFGDERPFSYKAKETEASLHTSFRREADIEKVRAMIGWEPEVSLDDGLKSTMAWVRGLKKRE